MKRRNTAAGTLPRRPLPLTSTAKAAKGEKVVVRRARLVDIPTINSVHRQAVLATPATLYSPDQLAAWARDPFKPQHIAKLVDAIVDEMVWVATQNGVIVGYAHAFWTAEEREVYLDSLYVLPTAAGGGIGSLLLATVEAAAADIQADVVRLHAALSARPFYLRQGFAYEGPISQHLIGTITMPWQQMCKFSERSA